MDRFLLEAPPWEWEFDVQDALSFGCRTLATLRRRIERRAKECGIDDLEISLWGEYLVVARPHWVLDEDIDFESPAGPLQELDFGPGD